MIIEKILSINGKIIMCKYSCEKCKFTFEGMGYLNKDFYENKLPNMKCYSCILDASKRKAIANK